MATEYILKKRKGKGALCTVGVGIDEGTPPVGLVTLDGKY